jgi:alpha/beta superfamily hydrolase
MFIMNYGLIKIMSPTQKLKIKNDNLTLEAELHQSSGEGTPLGVIIAHPHPQYGGDMYNNIVSSIFDKLIENQITCLRFNFRGVGGSSGKYDGDQGEREDARACIGFLIKNKQVEDVLLCGYSFGAAIITSLINYCEEIKAYCAISFPWDFMGDKYKELSQSSKPKLFIQGDRDDVAMYNRFDYHFAYYDDPKEKAIISGADHFYWGYEHQVAMKVFQFFNKFIKS